MKKNNDLDALLEKILSVSTPLEKLEILNECSEANEFVKSCHTLKVFLGGLSLDCDIAIKSILALGQGQNVFSQIDILPNPFESLRELLQPLLEVEKFYFSVGGIVGYYSMAIKLIANKKLPSCSLEACGHLLQPPYIDLSVDTPEIQKAITDGIENFSSIAVIYPIGGAGDRLDLRDEQTGEPLPAAYLPFGGFSLLEGLINDLQAIEFIFWKLNEIQLTTPVAMMTSEEKNNQKHILEICSSHQWFGRSSDSFRWFMQPLVPVVVETGDFSLCAPLKLCLKPGGHGVIWKLAQDNGIFTWFEELGRRKILVRQINNPVAGTDHGIIAFTGIGCDGDKAFGVASCPRLLNAAEGMLVLVEKEENGHHHYHISNVEYTDFHAFGLTDSPIDSGSPYSLYPANTNILFVDIDAVKEALKVTPFPGVLINLKNQVPYIDPQGNVNMAFGGRVESMMQNIADDIIDSFPKKLSVEEQEGLRSFLTYNDRRKTISVTKNQIREGKSILETPDACYFDQLKNSHELLTLHCQMKMAEIGDLESQIQTGPAYHVYYHPALGPLYQIIAQKIRGGLIEKGSELRLQIAELEMIGLQLNGSLSIQAIDILGHKDDAGIIKYSAQNGKCELINVKVINKGIDWSAENSYWRNKISRHEQLEIILHGNGEFFAEGVTFNKGQKFEVPNEHRLEVREHNGKIEQHLQQISEPTWHWKYGRNGLNGLGNAIILQKVFRSQTSINLMSTNHINGR
ncbi:MAG: hypothetical protein H0U49_11260 [Parachlamydiaceae bacterium]|nr:hypothetical protein [Parachlamydiaceae bacterium]